MNSFIDRRRRLKREVPYPQSWWQLVAAMARGTPWLAVWVSIYAAAPSGAAVAQATSLKMCTRAFGKWVEFRDANLRRLEAKPTVLGLDNSWCTPLPARVSDLRARLAGVREACAGLAEYDKVRIDALIGRAAQLLDRVQTCLGPPPGTTATVPDTWRTSVREAPQGVQGPTKVQMHTAAAGERRSAVGGDVAQMRDQRARQETRANADRAPAAGAGEARSSGAVAAGSPTTDGATGPRVVQAAPTHPGAAGAGKGAAKEPDNSKSEARPSAGPVDDDECLVVTQTSLATYLIENRNCLSQSVLTAIELRRPGQSVRCFTKKVAGQIAIAGEYGVAPQINFQCREGVDGCAEDVVRGMFPECQPG